MTQRTTPFYRQILTATLATCISASAAATPFDPSQPIGPAMKGLIKSITQATAAMQPRTAALVDPTNLPGDLYNPPEGERKFSSIWANQGSAGAHAKSQLNSTQAWSAAFNNNDQWLELPIPADSTAIGIVTQGRANSNQWVKAYRALARMPDGNLVALHGQNALPGNSNRSSITSHTFAAPPQAKAIRIIPTAWNNHISMRAALLIDDASCSATSNLIRNGSFEEHGPLNRGNWGTFAQIPGWTANTGHIELQKYQVGGIGAFEGQSKLELDAHHNSHIYTDVATTAQQNYQLSFGYAPRVARSGTDTNNIEVWWDGKKIRTLSGHQRQWQQVTLQLRASKPTTRLEFRGAGRSDGQGGYVDSVSLTADNNLLSNGSFEDHANINNGSWSTFNSIPGWQATEGHLEIQLGRTGGIHALDGDAKLELDAYRNSTVETTIDTVTDAQYTVSFAYSPRVNWHRTSTNNAEVWWNNTKIATLSGTKPTWHSYAIPVTASDTQTQLTFKATGRSDGLGALIDKVAVRPASNKISNGSFEQHGRLNHKTWGTFAQIPSWTSETGEIEIQRGRTGGIHAFHGRDKLELDARNNSTVSTDINTTAGNSYQLRLAYSPRVNAPGTDTNDVEIWWDNQHIDTLSGDERGWTLHTYSVSATSAQSKLSFKASGNNDSLGGLIDDLSLLDDGCGSAPSALSAVFDTPTEGQQLNQSNLTFVVDVTGTDTPATDVELSIDGQSSTVGCVADQLITARLHCDAPASLSDGEHTISATVSDNTGATGTSIIVNFGIDTDLPTITWLKPLDGAYLNAQPVVVSGKLTPTQDSITLNGDALSLDTEGNFDTSLTLPEGTHTLVLRAEDTANNHQTLTRTIVIDRSAPALPSIALIDFSEAPDGKIAVSGAAGSVEANTWVEISNTRTGEVIRVQADANGAFSAALIGELGDQFTITAVDAANNNSPVLEHTYSGNLPPDPATVAPPLPTTAITPPWEQWNFLHTGTNPIQREVAPDTFVDEHVALLRGRVLDMAGEPLPGARITIKDHPEYGYTLSRLDGMWDMVINGGGANVVDYQLDGYLHIQRRLDPNWLETQYAEDVVMTPLDDQVTEIDTSDTSQAFHVATGAHVTDRFGERKLHMLFPAGTQAHYKRADGTQVDLDNFHVRATEYTVGDLGPNAMPGDLPPASMYTYAMELTVDEASDAVFTEGRTVWFDKPVTVYLNNFLNASAGAAVPLGYYNREGATWEPKNDGVVVRVRAVENGKALLSFEEDQAQASDAQLEAFDITEEEQIEIANSYSAGESFWRVKVSHFSPWDLNFWTRTEALDPPDNEEDEEDENDEELCPAGGCIIDSLRQVVTEMIPLARSAPLVYRSDRVTEQPKSNYQITVRLTDGAPPALKFRATLVAEIAGQRIVNNWYFAANSTPLQTTVIEWDGLDAFGRPVTGAVDAQLTLRYHFASKALLQGPAALEGSSSGTSFGSAGAGKVIREVTMRDDIPTVTTTRKWTQTVIANSHPQLETAGFGDWVPSNLHHFNRVKNIVTHGDGTTYASGRAINRAVNLELTERPRYEEYNRGNSEHLEALYMALAPDGTVWLADSKRIWSINPEGVIEQRSGFGNTSSGNGGPFSSASFSRITDLELSQDGELWIADSGRLRVVDRDEIIRAAPKDTNFLDVGVSHLTIGPQGDVFVCNPFTRNGRVVIAKLSPSDQWSDAVIEGTDADRIFRFDGLSDCTATTDNRLLYGGETVAEVSLQSGAVKILAGGGDLLPTDWVDDTPGAELDTSAGVNAVVIIGSGNVIFTIEQKIYSLDQNNQLTLYAGDFSTHSLRDRVLNDRINAFEFDFNTVHQLKTGPAGRIWVKADHSHPLVFDRALPGFSSASSVVHDSEREYQYEFDYLGRHVRTLKLYTNLTLESFEYGTDGRLATIIDRDGRRTMVERIDESNIIIRSPDSQETKIEINDKGQLSSLTNPIGQRWEVDYLPDGGLIQQFTKPSGDTTEFGFDHDGLLVRDTDPAGGGWILEKEETGSQFSEGHEVTMISGEGRKRTASITSSSRGNRKYRYDFANGSFVDTHILPWQTTNRYADGRRIDRFDYTWLFSSLSPTSRSEVTYPSGLEYESRTFEEQVVDLNETVTGILRSVENENRLYTSEHNFLSQQITQKSPEGRTLLTQLDEQERPTQIEPDGLASTSIVWRADGQPETVTKVADNESRNHTFGYFADGPQKGYLQSITDPLGRVNSYERDAIGRTTKQILPDGRETAFSYDANGNLETLTPPGRSAHVFHYDNRDLPEQDQPPALDGSYTLTQYDFNKDKQLELVTRPSGQLIEYQYNAVTAQLESIETPQGRFTQSYKASAQIDTATTPQGETISYVFDGDRLTSQQWAGEVIGAVTVGFDGFSVSAPSELSVNNDNPINYTYDRDLLLTSAGSLAIVRDHPAGLISASKLGDVTIEQGYSGFGELREMSAVAKISEETDLYDYVCPVHKQRTQFATNVLKRFSFNDSGLLQSSQWISELGSQVDRFSFAYDNRQQVISYTDASNVTELEISTVRNKLDVELQHACTDWVLTPIGGGGSDTKKELWKATYTRDKLGRIETRTETLNGTTVGYGYTYDLAGRLEAVTTDGVETERYTYDDNSNRLTATINGVTTTATVDAQDRLLTYGNTGFDYTLNGELKSKTTNGVTTTFDYDVFGNLLNATLPGDVTIDYVVDAQHRRIGKKVNGILKQGFLYQDQLNPIAELDGDNNVVSRFIYGTRPNVPDYLIKDGKNYRIIADHLGSPRLVVDVASGDVVQRMDFDTFGNVINDTNPGFQPFGFAGGIYDHHTELTRFGARDYDASVGRWTAKDPIGFAGGDVNLYGYVAVDPVNFVDQNGKWIQLAAGVVNAAASGYISYANGGSASQIAGSAAFGFATGVVTGPSSLLKAIASGAITGAAGQAIDNFASCESIGNNILDSALAGAVSGALGKLGGDFVASNAHSSDKLLGHVMGNLLYGNGSNAIYANGSNNP